MYRKLHNGQLTIEEFHVPFGGKLDSDNRWVIFSSLMPWEELEQTYAPQFSPTTGAPAKPVRLAFGALFIKQRRHRRSLNNEAILWLEAGLRAAPPCEERFVEIRALRQHLPDGVFEPVEIEDFKGEGRP
jgi:hypothetical protein